MTQYVREFNDVQELNSLASKWQELLAQTPGATFFHSLEWLQIYWKHFGRGQRLRVLAISNPTGDIRGILPLVVRKSRRRLGGIRVLTYPLDDWASYYGPIGPQPEQTLAAGLRHVHQTHRDWQVIELPWVDSKISAGATERAFGNAMVDFTSESRETSAIVNLSDFPDWDAYWRSRESRWRNNVRRSERKLAGRGKVTYLRYRPKAGRDTNPRWDLYEACEAIARASWQAGSTSGTTLVHDSVQTFLRESHAVAARNGALDLNLLMVNSQPVAFNYAYCCDGNVFGLRTGYDSTAASEGAGTVLQARMIADSFARGDHLYNLGPGYLDCKRYWLTEARPSLRFSHFPSDVPVARLMEVKRRFEHWWRAGRMQPTSKQDRKELLVDMRVDPPPAKSRTSGNNRAVAFMKIAATQQAVKEE